MKTQEVEVNRSMSTVESLEMNAALRCSFLRVSTHLYKQNATHCDQNGLPVLAENPSDLPYPVR